MLGSPGFVIDGSDTSATSPAEIEQLIAAEPSVSAMIVPFLGGSEMLDDPQQRSDRLVIDCFGLDEDRLSHLPHLSDHLLKKVGNQRSGGRLKDLEYWKYERSRPAMRKAIHSLDRVLMHPYTSSHLAFAFVSANTLIATPHCVFATQSNMDFGVMQSRVHECWARFFASSLKDDLRYTPTDCFDTFATFQSEASQVSDVAKAYYEFRARLMIERGEGLTKTYNRFHDPHEKSSEIAQLRELHAAMDRAVLEAYGWADLAQTAHCEFLLDYEEEDDDEPAGKKKSKKKKPWRLRWPDDFRDEVLARLLELNEQRHQEEQLLAKSETSDKTATKDKKRKEKAVKKTDHMPLLDDQ